MYGNKSIPGAVLDDPETWWQPTPDFTPAGPLDIGEVSLEHLRDLATHVFHWRTLTPDQPARLVDQEILLELLHRLSAPDWRAVRAARLALREGVTASEGRPESGWELNQLKDWAMNNGTGNYWTTNFMPDRPELDFYTVLDQERMVCVLSHILGEVPDGESEVIPILSLPTSEDFSIDPAALLERLRRYETYATPLEGDLFLALCRLDWEKLKPNSAPENGENSDETATRLLNELCACQLRIHSTDGELESPDGGYLTVGQVVAAWASDPPRNERDPYTVERGWNFNKFPGPALFPRRVTSRDARWNFPTMADCLGEGMMLLSYTPFADDAYYHQVAGPIAAAQMLGQNREDEGFHPQITIECFARGVLRPGVAEVKYLLNWEGKLINLPLRVKFWRGMATRGLASVIWDLADAVLVFAAGRTRMPHGLELLLELMEELLPAARSAVAQGIVSAEEVFALPGLRSVAARSGNGKALKAARALLQQVEATV